MLVCGKELGQMIAEELTIKLYDFDAKKELPQSVQCFSELHGANVQVAVQRQTVDKTKKDESGNYLPTGEVYDQNEIVKFFPEGKRVTISEVADYIKSLGSTLDDVIASGHLLKAINKMPVEGKMYADTWLERHRGQTYNKSSGAKKEGKAFTSSSASNTAKTDLFAD